MTHVGLGRRLIATGAALIIGTLVLQPPAGLTELAASVGLLLVICGGFLWVYRFRGGPPAGGGFWGGGPPSGGGGHHHGGGLGGHGGGGGHG
jgi:hypothetical protein